MKFVNFLRVFTNRDVAGGRGGLSGAATTGSRVHRGGKINITEENI